MKFSDITKNFFCKITLKKSFLNGLNRNQTNKEKVNLTFISKNFEIIFLSKILSITLLQIEENALRDKKIIIKM